MKNLFWIFVLFVSKCAAPVPGGVATLKQSLFIDPQLLESSSPSQVYKHFWDGCVLQEQEKNPYKCGALKDFGGIVSLCINDKQQCIHVMFGNGKACHFDMKAGTWYFFGPDRPSLPSNNYIVPLECISNNLALCSFNDLNCTLKVLPINLARYGGRSKTCVISNTNTRETYLYQGRSVENISLPCDGTLYFTPYFGTRALVAVVINCPQGGSSATCIQKNYAVVMCNAETGKEIYRLPIAGGLWKPTICASYSGGLLAVAPDYGVIKIFDITQLEENPTGKLLCSMPLPAGRTATAMNFSQNDGTLLVACSNGRLLLYNLVPSLDQTGRLLSLQMKLGEMLPLSMKHGNVYAINVSPDGTKIVAGYHDGCIHYWRACRIALPSDCSS